MPDNNAQSDIDFQPKTKEYSFSSAPEEKKKLKEKLNTILTLVFSIFGFLFLLFVFLAALNYFNIISLSKLNPLLFGGLPHQITITPETPIAYDLTNKARQTKIKAIRETMQKEKLPAPYQLENGNWIAKGYVTAFGKSTIQLLTPQNFINFYLEKKTIFLKQPPETPPPATSGAEMIGEFPSYDYKSFFNIIKYGDYLNIEYEVQNKSDNYAIKVQYY